MLWLPTGDEIANKKYDGPVDALSLLVCENQCCHALYSLQAASLLLLVCVS